ncbi:MAG: DUF2513 domain-containing protein [Telluria sp.]
MKRDWDIVREVLIEVESLSEFERGNSVYEVGGDIEIDSPKNLHALMLWRAGYLTGIDASTLSGPALISPDLSWAGHDLLDTLRSSAVWERIKTTAKEKGIELTFDAVKALGKTALDWVIAN